MMSLSTQHYQSLLEEIQSCKTEENFVLSIESVKFAHAMGEIIRRYAKGDITTLLTQLAVDVGISERTLWRRVELYDKFPDIQKVIESHGKNISINKLIGSPSKEKPETKCKNCPLHCKS